MAKKHDPTTQAKYRKSYGGGHGFTVQVRQNSDGSSDINSALRQLKKRLTTEGFAKEIRAKEFHVTKGEVRRRKKAEAIRRQRRQRLRSNED